MSSLSASLVLAWVVSAAPADLSLAAAVPVRQLTRPPITVVSDVRFPGRNSAPHPAGGHATDGSSPELDVAALFGFLSVMFALLCLAYERASRAFGFGLVVACAMTAVYAVLAGAWPLSVLQFIWSVAAFRRWRASAPPNDVPPPPLRRRATIPVTHKWNCESRLSRMFGPP